MIDFDRGYLRDNFKSAEEVKAYSTPWILEMPHVPWRFEAPPAQW